MSKRSRFIIFAVIVSAMLIGAIVSGSPAFADGLYVNSTSIEGSTTISIVGTTDRLDKDVTFTVIAPNGNIVSIDQVTPDADGSLITNIEVGGSVWKQDGVYAIKYQQHETEFYNGIIQVEIVDGVVVPEFGTIAMMILAVAIISIIAVTAKTRLPRF